MAAEYGILDTAWGWGAAFVDMDLDGDQDLYAVQGMREHVADESPHLANATSKLFLDDGTGTAFASAPASGCEVPGDQRALVAFDYNRDGAPDLLITQVGAPTVLLQNYRRDAALVDRRARWARGRGHQRPDHGQRRRPLHHPDRARGWELSRRTPPRGVLRPRHGSDGGPCPSRMGGRNRDRSAPGGRRSGRGRDEALSRPATLRLPAAILLTVVAALVIDGCSCNTSNTFDQRYCESYSGTTIVPAVVIGIGFFALTFLVVMYVRRRIRQAPEDDVATDAPDSVDLSDGGASARLEGLIASGAVAGRIVEGYDGRWVVELTDADERGSRAFVTSWSTREAACREALEEVERTPGLG